MGHANEMAHRCDATQASSAVQGNARQDTSANSSHANTNTLTIAATGTSAEIVGTKGTRAARNPRATTAIGQQTDSLRLGTSPTLSASGVLASIYVSSVASWDTPTRTVPATATTTATLSPTRQGLVRPRGTLPQPRLHQPTIAIRTVPRAKATTRTRQVVISATPLVRQRSLRPSNDTGPGSRTTPR